jgi:SAM-dependent methyltransferase
MNDHVSVNRDYWDGMADDWVAAGERLWALDVPQWGIWHTPDERAPLLPEDMTGMTAIELGCGTGYVSGWMVRRGAKVTAIDVSARQLETARKLAHDHGADVSFIEGNAEDTRLPSESFDFAVSEYGAAIWCDPEIWLREAYRLLKTGGRLSFLGSHPMVMIATPESGAAADYGLHRSYRQLGRLDWTKAEVDPGGIEFNRSIESWIRLFHDIGFRVSDYRELYSSPDSHAYVDFVSPEWAREYPSEQVWWLQKE